MSCDVKGYFKVVHDLVLEQNPGVRSVGKEVLGNISESADKRTKSIVEKWLTDELNGYGYHKVYSKPEGLQGFDGQITNVKLRNNGNVDIKLQKRDGTSYNYNDIDIRTGKTKAGQRINIMLGFEDKIMPIRAENYVSGMVDITKPLSEVSANLNRHVSYMLIGGAETGGKLIAPHVDRWHDWAMNNSDLYKESINLVRNGFGHPDLWDKIKANLFISGDVDRTILNKATTIADIAARRTYELIDTELPKLDKDIQKVVTNKKDREQLDVIFGTSGFGNLMYMPEVVQAIYDGVDLSDVKKMVQATPEDIKKAKILKDYMVNRKVKKNVQNSDGNVKIAVMATLLALEETDSRGKSAWDTMVWLRDTRPEMFIKLEKLSGTVHTLNEVVNRGKQGTSFGNAAGSYYRGWDGHNTLDVTDTVQEYKIISQEDIDRGVYLSENSPWKLIREPSDDSFGIIARESTKSFMDGIGVNTNRIRNGVGISRNDIKKNKDGSPDTEWMEANNIVMDYDNGYERFRVVLRPDEFSAVGGKKNIAERLMRTYTHNKELIETESVRKLIKDEMTYKGGDGVLDNLNGALINNKRVKKDERTSIKPFIKTKLDWEKDVKVKYPEVYAKYKKVENISNYGDFDKDIQYVRRDMADMLVGHRQSLISSDEYPNFQKWERLYKQVVQLMKLKMVVANPAKLAADVASNFGILMTMDVSISDTWRYSKEAVKYSDEMSRLEGELVAAKFDLGLAEVDGTGLQRAQARVDKAQKAIENHPYYDAVKSGFVQSMGTSMMIKEFDTISGLQNTIDQLARKLVETNDGSKTEVHRAIKWWMDAGFGVNDILDYLSEIERIKGTAFATEFKDISRRLKDKKQTEDTVRYISEFIAAPSSEVVRQGSRAMQLGDAMARWSLYNHELNKKLSEYKKVNKRVAEGSELEKIKEESSELALDTFVDYRLNVPSEIKFLSDYGFLLFPSFWMRTQRVIYNLLRNHPLNAGAGLMIADLMGNAGANIISANIVNKAWNGSLVYPGGQTHNLADSGTYVWNPF